MPIDPSVIRMNPIEQPDLLGSVGKVMAIKQMAQQGRMQEVELQQHQIALQQAQQDQKDQQTLMQVMAQVSQQNPNATMRDVLPLISGKVSPRTMFAIQKQDLDAREKLAKIHTDELGTLKYKTDQYTQLLNDAKNVPPEQWAAAYPVFRAKAMELSPDGKLQLPEQPVPQEMIPLFGIGLRTTEQALADEKAKRDQAEEQRKAARAPFEQAKAEADAKKAQQEADGTQPLTQFQIAELKRRGIPNTPTELAIAANDPNRTPEERLMAKSALKELERHTLASRPVTNVSVGGQDAGALTKDDYKRAGAEYAITGVMPPLGNGSGAVKQRIIHEKMEFARNSGLSPRDMALAGAAFKGDSKSLAQFQTQRDQIVSFEQTAQKNLDLFINAASKIPDTGVPWLNKPIRELDEKLVGSANMAAVNAARQVANNEIAKVTSGGGLSGVLSDSARHEVEAYNPKSATLGQTLAVAKALKQDMANRHKSMDDTLSAIRGRIGTFGNTPTSAGEQTGGVEKWDFVNGKLTKVGGK